MIAECPISHLYNITIREGDNDLTRKKLRVLDYFRDENPEWYAPLDLFPRIFFVKDKMSLCHEPYVFDDSLKKEVFDKVFSYVLSLGINKLYMPYPDSLQKYGNQRYNDNGVVRFDYERPVSSFDSSFLYQEFLTKPLTPRQVWLPGKAIKQNNAFFMLVHRQILDADPRYPSVSEEEVKERLSAIIPTGALSFDISGFGFQYCREILIEANRAIQELFPCTVYDEQTEIFERILSDVEVIMPQGDRVRPIRGVGLGYWEDLKTIAMMAILAPFNPISLYGDQGILPLDAFDFFPELLKFQFILNFEKVGTAASTMQQTKWGGVTYTLDSHIKHKRLSEKFLGSFFARTHWERKSALVSFLKDDNREYIAIQKRIADMYEKTFGYEFYPKDIYNHYERGGIIDKAYDTGYIRMWWVRGQASPRSNLLFDAKYQTPFKRVGVIKTSLRMAKDFSQKRKALYRKNQVFDSTLYDYLYPRIEYNKKDKILPRVIPRWADLNLILLHGVSGNSLTCGLSPEEMKKAILYQSLSSDPFRARATGGYKVNTVWRTERPPDQEWVDIQEALEHVEPLSYLYVHRADLHQNPDLMNDPMYRDTNLFHTLIDKSLKRKRSIHSLGDHDEHDLRRAVMEKLPALINSGKVNNLPDIVRLVGDELGDLEPFDKSYGSEHGSVADDDAFFMDDIVMIDP